MTIPKNPGSNPMFSFEGKTQRVVAMGNKPWWVITDTLRCMDRKSLPSNSLQALDADEVMVINKRNSDYSLTDYAEVFGRVEFKQVSSITLVSESGLYKLILRANPKANPTARRFQNWVTREVLPALRQDGMYVMGEEKVKTGEMSEAAGKPFTGSFTGLPLVKVVGVCYGRIKRGAVCPM